VDRPPHQPSHRSTEYNIRNERHAIDDNQRRTGHLLNIEISVEFTMWVDSLESQHDEGDDDGDESEEADHLAESRTSLSRQYQSASSRDEWLFTFLLLVLSLSLWIVLGRLNTVESEHVKGYRGKCEGRSSHTDDIRWEYVWIAVIDECDVKDEGECVEEESGDG
jgi:hypothetical protein